MWLLHHAVASAALALAGLPVYVKCCGWLCIAIGLWVSRPARCRPLLAAADGTWSVPLLGLSGARVLPSTRLAPWWVELRLCDGDGRQTVVVIWRDGLTAGDWRRLLIVLREARGPSSR